MMSAALAETPGRPRLRLREAFVFFAWQSVRLRLGRMLVVLLGISCAMAFLAILLGTERIMAGLQALAPNGGAEPADARKLQQWWMIVAVLIATVGVTNAVLLSVTERIREIGTLKCLGASAFHIVEIFMLETLLLGGLGGLLGGVAGVLATVALLSAQLQADLWLVFGWPDALRLVGISFVLALAISLLAAVVPAVFAARIEPAEAMRYDV